MPAGKAGRERTPFAADLFGIPGQTESHGFDSAADPGHESHEFEWIDRDESVRRRWIIEMAPRAGLEELTRAAPSAASVGAAVRPGEGQDSGQLEDAQSFDAPPEILQTLYRYRAGAGAGEPEFVVDGQSHSFLAMSRLSVENRRAGQENPIVATRDVSR
jgi:hypothetical protein